MCDINDPFHSMYRISKTESNNTCSVDLKTDQHEDQNDYKTFFEKDNFEKYIESYPKTKVKVKVLGYVQIPD